MFIIGLIYNCFFHRDSMNFQVNVQCIYLVFCINSRNFCPKNTWQVLNHTYCLQIFLHESTSTSEHLFFLFTFWRLVFCQVMIITCTKPFFLNVLKASMKEGSNFLVKCCWTLFLFTAGLIQIIVLAFIDLYSALMHISYMQYSVFYKEKNCGF